MIISPSFTFMSCLMCNLSCFTSDKTNWWPTHLSLTERQLLFASFWIGRHRRRVVVEQCHKDPRGARAKTPETHETYWDIVTDHSCLKLWSYLQIPLHQTPKFLSCETSRMCLVSFFLGVKIAKQKKSSVISKICWQLCVSVKLALINAFHIVLARKTTTVFTKITNKHFAAAIKASIHFFFFQTLVLHLVLVGCGEYHGDLPSLSLRLVCSLLDYALICWLAIPLRSLE